MQVGETVMMYGSAGGNIEIVELFLASGASVRDKNNVSEFAMYPVVNLLPFEPSMYNYRKRKQCSCAPPGRVSWIW